MLYIIDRIENGIAVCECKETGERLEIEVKVLPAKAKEGDIIKKDNDSYILDLSLTKKRKAELTDRLNRLFQKH